MPGRNGIETAACIRKCDRDAVIIFITDHKEYVYEVLETLPFRFLPKTAEKEALRRALLDAAAHIISDSQQIFFFRISHEQHQLLSKDILYFEGAGIKMKKRLLGKRMFCFALCFSMLVAATGCGMTTSLTTGIVSGVSQKVEKEAYHYASNLAQSIVDDVLENIIEDDEEILAKMEKGQEIVIYNGAGEWVRTTTTNEEIIRFVKNLVAEVLSWRYLSQIPEDAELLYTFEMWGEDRESSLPVGERPKTCEDSIILYQNESGYYVQFYYEDDYIKDTYISVPEITAEHLIAFAEAGTTNVD